MDQLPGSIPRAGLGGPDKILMDMSLLKVFSTALLIAGWNRLDCKERLLSYQVASSVALLVSKPGPNQEITMVGRIAKTVT